jgi:hypothetical protein
MIESFFVLNQLLISYFHVEFPLVLVKLTREKVDIIFQKGAVDIKKQNINFSLIFYCSQYFFIEKSTPIILFFKRK